MTVEVENLVFRSALEGLLVHALDGRLTEPLRDRLRQLGADPKAPLPSALPAATFTQLIDACAEEVFRGLPRNEALRQLGRASVEGQGRTELGKAMVAMSRLLGPARTLSRLQQDLGTSASGQAARLTEISPTMYKLRVAETHGAPEYYLGVISALLERCGALHPHVEIASSDRRSCSFSIRWAA